MNFKNRFYSMRDSNKCTNRSYFDNCFFFNIISLLYSLFGKNYSLKDDTTYFSIVTISVVWYQQQCCYIHSTFSFSMMHVFKPVHTNQKRMRTYKTYKSMAPLKLFNFAFAFVGCERTLNLLGLHHSKIA